MYVCVYDEPLIYFIIKLKFVFILYVSYVVFFFFCAPQVVKNPIVFMVLIGIMSHFLFGRRVPLLLGEFVDGLADSFGGAALFYLGLTMVGQMGRVTRSTGVTLILLLTAKLWV